jgi:transposase
MAVEKERRRARPRGAPTVWRVPDDLWNRIAMLLPIEEFRPTGGRRWTPPRRILDGVLYVLRTGCQWQAVPREYGSGSTLHRRFQRWVDRGCWEAIWRRLLQHYDRDVGLEWRWQAADASLHKAPLGGEKNRSQSYRPRQGRHQAASPHRRYRHPDRRCPHCGEPA